MKIQIKGEKNITLVLPTRMIFSKKVYHLVTRAARNCIPAVVYQIPSAIVDAALDELIRTKKLHGAGELLEISSAGDESIKITL